MTAYVSKGITVVFTGASSGSLTAELLDVTVDASKTDQIDTTHQTTTGAFRSFLSGLTDGQSVTLTLNFDADNTRPAAGEAGTLVITMPFTAMTKNTLTISCNVEEIGNIDAALGARVGEAIKFKITAAPTWSTVTTTTTTAA